MKHRNSGFTLVEVMIVVAIVGILAAVAYPSYRESVLKGRRAEARAALTDILQQQERYLTQQNTYKIFSAGAAISPTQPFKTYTGENPTSANYKIKAEKCGAASIQDCVLLTAVPREADAVVGEIFIQSSGLKGCSVAGSTRCWK